MFWQAISKDHLIVLLLLVDPAVCQEVLLWTGFQPVPEYLPDRCSFLQRHLRLTLKPGTLVKMVMPSAQNLVKLLLMVKWFTSTSLVNRPKVSLLKSTVSHTTTMLILEPVCQTPFSRLKARPTNSTLMVTENLSDN